MPDEVLNFAPGDYCYLRGGFPYSQGVRALDTFALERVRFRSPPPLDVGFAAIARYLELRDRPRQALCAMELRSPRAMSMAEFDAFNRSYVAVLTKWGIVRDGLNPVARSNVIPESNPPERPLLYAFSYSMPEANAATFVVSGSGEWPEGGAFPADVVAYGDTSSAGIAVKAQFVVAKMAQRMRGLGVDWSDAAVAQVYSAFGLDAALRKSLATATANLSLECHYCRPPIAGLDFEMDVRSVRTELQM
jgi:hypothetical protein